MVRAHAYWAAFGLRSELAVLCTPSTSTDDEPRLFDRARQEVDAGPGAALIGKPGGIFVLDGTTLDEGDRILLQSVARIVITDANELSAPLALHFTDATPGPGYEPEQAPALAVANHPLPDNLFAFNGYGGFTPDGREYVITTSATRMTPAPGST